MLGATRELFSFRTSLGTLLPTTSFFVNPESSSRMPVSDTLRHDLPLRTPSLPEMPTESVGSLRSSPSPDANSINTASASVLFVKTAAPAVKSDHVGDVPKSVAATSTAPSAQPKRASKTVEADIAAAASTTRQRRRSLNGKPPAKPAAVLLPAAASVAASSADSDSDPAADLFADLAAFSAQQSTSASTRADDMSSAADKAVLVVAATVNTAATAAAPSPASVFSQRKSSKDSPSAQDASLERLEAGTNVTLIDAAGADPATDLFAALGSFTAPRTAQSHTTQAHAQAAPAADSKAYEIPPSSQSNPLQCGACTAHVNMEGSDAARKLYEALGSIAVSNTTRAPPPLPEDYDDEFIKVEEEE